MCELKTLKDIPKCYDCECLDEKCVIHFLLRREAIKWVKDIDKDLFRMGGRLFPRSPDGLIATRQWIMNFFNITEEELKNPEVEDA